MNLTPAQIRVLDALVEHGELVEKRIAPLAKIGGPQGVSVITRSLMAKGLIERGRVTRTSELDSYYVYRPTAAGREVAAL